MFPYYFGCQAEQCLSSLSECQGVSSTQQLYDTHTRPLVHSLQDSYMAWTVHSEERLLFDALIIRCGRSCWGHPLKGKSYGEKVDLCN